MKELSESWHNPCFNPHLSVVLIDSKSKILFWKNHWLKSPSSFNHEIDMILFLGQKKSYKRWEICIIF